VADQPETRGKILLVDDDRVTRSVLDRRLRQAGYAVAFAFDAVSAVAVARSESPDLIVLDLGLPGGDGFVVIERLSRIQTLAHIPVVVLTSREAAREQAIAAGATAFVEKSGNLDEVMETIRDQLHGG